MKNKIKNQGNFKKTEVTNKKKVVIEIEDDLTPEQEVFAIATKLQQQHLLGSSSTAKKLIGSGHQTKVKHLETTITIKRVSKENPVVMINCSVCNTGFDTKLGVNYYHNYGGIPKKNQCCSDSCVDTVISINPERISKKKRQVKHSFLYNHYGC